MARETKVGLLVGLGFIICFAVILENRGRREAAGPLMPHQVLSQAATGLPAPTSTAAERRAQEYGRSTARPAVTPPPRPPAARQATPRPANRAGRQRPTRRVMPPPETSPDAKPTRSLADILNGTPPAPREAGGPARRRVVPAVGPQQSPSAPAGPQLARGATPVSEAGPPAPSAAPDPSGPVTLAGTSAEDPSAAARSQPPARPQPVAAQAVRRYRVRKGDTLTGIAAEQYGTRSKRVIDAIYEANRSELSSPNALRPDQELVLPEIEGVSTPAEGPGETPPAEQRAPKPETKQPYRYYQVRQGDRYATIARRTLGSESRWREIAELNKDIFPNPARIRYGVRIRLPADAKTD